uniref:Uncharacterized protein n=1 Tax=Arundo donax TaxID=35708 RepID=A0A0A9TLG4_ARUDO
MRSCSNSTLNKIKHKRTRLFVVLYKILLCYCERCRNKLVTQKLANKALNF